MEEMASRGEVKPVERGRGSECKGARGFVGGPDGSAKFHQMRYYYFIFMNTLKAVGGPVEGIACFQCSERS